MAKELFGLNIPRDNYSSARKGKSLAIIGQLMKYYKIPENFNLFLIGLRSKKNKLIVETLTALTEYFEYNDTEKELPQNIIGELNKLVLKSKERTVVSGALNLQVVAGQISEFEALSEMDEWKEKNYY